MTMQPGDLILVYRGNGLFDKLVRWATVSPFYHVAMVVDSQDLIEAAFGGVRYADVNKYQGKSVVLSPVGATPAQRAKAVAEARLHWRQPYGFKDILVDALRIGLHVPIGYRWRTWHGYDCSALVANCWALAGLPLTYAPVPSPADLGWSTTLQGPRPWSEPSH